MSSFFQELLASIDPVFTVLMLTLGGAAAAVTGRAIASTWRPFWHLFVYIALLTAAVRFLHYALFHGLLLSVPAFILDALALMAIAAVGFRLHRVRQMTGQYAWLYEADNPFAWRRVSERR